MSTRMHASTHKGMKLAGGDNREFATALIVRALCTRVHTSCDSRALQFTGTLSHNDNAEKGAALFYARHKPRATHSRAQGGGEEEAGTGRGLERCFCL